MAAPLDDTMPATSPLSLPAMAGDPPTRDALLRLAHYVTALTRLATAAAAARRAGGGSSSSPPPPPSSLEAALGTTRRLVRLATLPTLFTPPPRSRPVLDTPALDAAAAVSEMARAAYLLADGVDLVAGLRTTAALPAAADGLRGGGAKPTPRPRQLARLAALLRAVAAVAAAAVAIREASATEQLWRERWGAGAATDASDDAGVRTWVARKRAYQWVVAVKYAGDVLMSVGMLRAPVPGVVGGTGEALGGVVGSVVRCWQRWPRK